MSTYEMSYRHLGKTGLKVSAFSLGSWITFGEKVQQDDCTQIVKLAYELGINFFDGAEVYAQGMAEEAFQIAFQQLGLKRSDLVISTKIYWGGKGVNQVGLSAKHLTEGLNESLKRYKTDYVDLIYCHRPDLKTPLEETVRTMDNLIRQGKALYWGTSEWSGADIGLAIGIAKAHSWHPPLFEQPQYNMLHRERVEREYHSLFVREGYGATIWSPLLGGVLTGKYLNGIPDHSRFGKESLERNPETTQYLKNKQLTESHLNKVRELIPIAQSIDCSITELALAWTLKNPHVSCTLLGATSTKQLKENCQALRVLPLMNQSIIDKIEKILNNKPEAPFSRT